MKKHHLAVLVVGVGIILGFSFFHLAKHTFAYTIPTVATVPATSITLSSAVLNGNLISTGLGSATSTSATGTTFVGFQLGTTTAYGTTLPVGTMLYPGAFNAIIATSTLTCNTLYHFRAYATNPAGTAYGTPDMTFTTLPCSTAYLPQTLAYISAETAGGATFTTAQKDAINRWFQDMLGYANSSYPTSNVLSKIKVAYLSLTGTYGADRVNAVTPGTYNYTDTGMPAYSTTGKDVHYNGTSQYSDTGFTPNGSAVFTTSNFTGFGVHRVDAGGGVAAVQTGETASGNATYLLLGYTGTTRMMLNGAKIAYNQVDTNPINGFWFTSWSDPTTLNTYYNGTKIKTVASTFGATPTLSLYQGAYHLPSTPPVPSPGYAGVPTTLDFHVEVTGAWSDAEAQLLYNATKALRLSFGSTWL